MAGSEVARLLEEIELTYRAAQRGLNGLAEGVPKHEFITKKMEHIEEKRVVLVGIVGSDKAMELIVGVLANVEEEKLCVNQLNQQTL